ncbi:MAG TPA: glycosyltransferase [Pyrinomonadaceae bacterium]|nr:glycosyltransferase [Pyrinomonadaceae bacterium]
MLQGRRIVFLLGNLELGGAERQALILARYLAGQQQAAVQVWGFNKTGPVAQICERHGLPWRVIPYPFTGTRLNRARGLVRVCAALRQTKPDILLPYTLGPNIVCGLIWRWTGARASVWNQRDEGIVPYGSPIARWAAKRTPRFIANSAGGARFLIEKLLVDKAKVTVIHNGIETAAPELDRRAWRERLAVNDRSFVACMVANLHALKDHVTLLHAWQKVVNGFENNGCAPLLVLAGRHDGAYEYLAALAADLKLDGTVRFAGQVSDVSGLLGAADVSVFSSRSEGCPNGVLESMAAGLPVAGTDIEGIREIVGPAGAQFLTPAGDADSLAGVLLKLARDPELCAREGARNRERIRERYDAMRMCKETVDVLTRL